MKTIWRRALEVGLVLAGGLIEFNPAAAATSAESRPAFTIHVRNYARVAPGTLAEAEQVATTVFRRAGIEARWQEIAVNLPNRSGKSNDTQPFTRADIQVNIFPNSVPTPAGLPENAMGVAPGAGPDRSLVFVFESRVHALDSKILRSFLNGDIDRLVSEGQLLGHVIAHEAGHLLLNQQAHSPRGIMRGEWVFADFRDMTGGLLLFTPQQVEFLRNEVVRRNAQEPIKVATVESFPTAR